jgi:uncharacterized membrane protein
VTQGRDPVTERYLARFRDGLRGASAAERAEFAREIESHIAEAAAGGDQVTAVLERLGPADRLARAYRAELTLKSRTGNLVWRFFAVLGLLVTASIPTMIVIPLLLGLGIGFLVGGAAAIGVAVFPFAELYDMPGAVPAGADRLLVGLTGAGLLVAGVLALWVLYLYVLLLIKAMRGALAIGS